jgi:predicted dinucleotide-binding enzyme
MLNLVSPVLLLVRAGTYRFGDDERSKNTVMQLAEDIDFDPLDCGSLKEVRYLERMGY